MAGRADPVAEERIAAARAVGQSILAIRSTREAGTPEIAQWVFRPRVATIIAFVAEQMGLRKVDIVGLRRTRSLVRARAAITWIARTVAGRSWKEIGRMMGGRHHTTIMNHMQVAERLCERDPAFRLVTRRATRHFQERTSA